MSAITHPLLRREINRQKKRDSFPAIIIYISGLSSNLAA
jgi:hypothetical protein